MGLTANPSSRSAVDHVGDDMWSCADVVDCACRIAAVLVEDYSQMASLRFASGPAASWIAPASLADEARTMLRRHGLDGDVSFFEGDFRADGDGPHIATTA